MSHANVAALARMLADEAAENGRLADECQWAAQTIADLTAKATQREEFIQWLTDHQTNEMVAYREEVRNEWSADCAVFLEMCQDEAAALNCDLDDMQAEWAAEHKRLKKANATLNEAISNMVDECVALKRVVTDLTHQRDNAQNALMEERARVAQLRIDLKAADEYVEKLQVENHGLGETVTRYGARIKWLEDGLGENTPVEERVLTANLELHGRIKKLEADIQRLIEDNTRLRMQPYEESKRIQEAVAALRAMASLDVELTPAGILAVANRLHSGPRAPSIPRHVQPPIEEMDA